jgi:ubiquinone/menaquinone biosynthesis C-methylase UbiE
VPSIDENIDRWNEDYNWDEAGEPWSKPWGSAAAQWYGCIYPRIRNYLPASAVLEIAPGFGRWTKFLLEQCDTLIGVDVTPKCIEACRQRFAGREGTSFEVNDGESLPMVSDNSIDFAFSFDSLVHVEAEVLARYLEELARVLKPEGVAFLHHSNYGTYQRSASALAPLQDTLDRLPVAARAALLRTGTYRGAHWRAPSVTAARMQEMSEAVSLRCIGQELINWEGGVLLLDCLSVITPAGSSWDHPNRVVKNHLFRLEARSIRRASQVYDTGQNH